ncbi:MAG: galactose-1-phosphate uridylyltransferase [Hydrogenoanaerobacterium sp.]
MAELRWHPFTQDWVMIASHRQARPQMPKDWCPFCPGENNDKLPKDYDVYEYDNDFPALSNNPPVPDDVANGFFKTAEAYGKCEVILYSPGHETTIPQLSDEHMTKLVELWSSRFTELSKDEKVKYIFIFENRGDLVGVTMPHPHGQIYAYPFVPKKIELEVKSAKEHLAKNDECIYCRMLKEELAFSKRVIFTTKYFTVFLPFFTEYPYGVYIFANRHAGSINELSAEEKADLGVCLKKTVGMLDSLFGFKFPYMMCMHNAPVNSGDTSEYWHFHIEFFPPLRAADKQKFNASSETGVWAHCNPTCPEDTAQELRDAYKRYTDKK